MSENRTIHISVIKKLGQSETFLRKKEGIVYLAGLNIAAFMVWFIFVPYSAYTHARMQLSRLLFAAKEF